MTADKERRHILFVDDELASQRLVARVLMAGIPGARVTCAGNGLQALQVLERGAVDLLITDVMMPEMDGIELLRHVANRQWMLPIMVVTSQGSRTLETGALAGMAIECFEKPLEAEPFVDCVRELLAAAAQRSHLEGVSIAGFVQLLSMEGKTCTLRATVPGAQGVLYFQSGRLVDAREGQRSGVAAALEIFTWKSPTITLEALVRNRQTTIDAGITELLLDSARLADERERSQRRSSAQALSSACADIGPAFPEVSEEDDMSGVAELVRSAPAQRPAAATSPAPSGPVAAPPSLSDRPTELAPRKAVPPVPPPPRMSIPPTAAPRIPAASRRPPVGVAGPVAPSPPSVPAIEQRSSPPPITPSAPEPQALTPTSGPTITEAFAAQASVEAPARSDADRVAEAAPMVTHGPAVAWPRGFPETSDPFELIDHARDLMRVAEFETAETLLLRALVLRPGDRVIQQNLRALARRRGE